jgi:hypothetical protein
MDIMNDDNVTHDTRLLYHQGCVRWRLVHSLLISLLFSLAVYGLIAWVIYRWVIR